MIELGLNHGDRGLNFIGDRLHMKGGSVHSLGLGVCWCGLGGIGVEGGGEVVVVASLSLLLLSR